MPKQIDEIMKISNKGYVDDFGDIAEILEHFLSYTVEELTCVLPPGYKFQAFADDVVRKLGNIEHENNDTAYTDSLRLSELLCLMRYFELSVSGYIDVILSYMKNLRNNINSAKILPWAELFLAISVKPLMDFFDEKSKTNEHAAIYQSICGLSKKYAALEVTEYTTLKMLLDGTCGDMFASWNPGFDKDEYFAKIENCCRIIKNIFVDSIAEWYYDRFDLCKLSEKINGKIIKFDEANDYDGEIADICL